MHSMLTKVFVQTHVFLKYKPDFLHQGPFGFIQVEYCVANCKYRFLHGTFYSTKGQKHSRYRLVSLLKLDFFLQSLNLQLSTGIRVKPLNIHNCFPPSWSLMYENVRKMQIVVTSFVPFFIHVYWLQFSNNVSIDSFLFEADKSLNLFPIMESYLTENARISKFYSFFFVFNLLFL